MFKRLMQRDLEHRTPTHFAKRICALIAVCASLCFLSKAQGPASKDEAAAPVNGAALTRANADAISVDLVVRDKRKRPVLDLTAAEIAVGDAGTPVQLSGLHLVTAQSGNGATIDLLFDHMTPQSAKVAQDIAAKLVSMAPQQSSFAVLGLDRGLRLFQKPTRDRAAIQTATVQAIDVQMRKDLTAAEGQIVSVTQTGALPSGLNASIEDRAMARMMLSALEESQRIVQDQHAAPALAGLEALAKSQQDLAGRKIIVFFSEGLRANANTQSITREVVEAANRAGISIYTIDTNGVDSKSFDVLTMMYQPAFQMAPRSSPSTIGMWNAPDTGRIGLMGDTLSDAPSPTSAARDSNTPEGDSLALLANGTGGFSISVGDNLREPLQRLIGDIATYYEATYTPALKAYDGKFHPIDIASLREGVSIRSRAGYFAVAPEGGGSVDVRPFEAPLLQILGDSPLPAGVAFQQAVLRLGGDSARTANDLVIEVPFSHLELRRDEHTMLYAAHLSILAQIRDKSGVVIERFSQDFSRNGALETIEAARAGVITLQRHFNAAPGTYLLEAVVLDRFGEKAGAQRTEFTIPVPVDGPWISDITMVRRTEPFGSALDPTEPMQYAKARVVPNLAQQVAAKTPRISFFFRIHCESNPADKNGKLEVDVQRDGKSVAHSSMDIVHSSGSDTVQDLATIESNALIAGNYHAVFTYTQGDKSTARDLPFTVDGSPVAGEDASPERTDDSSKDAAGKDAVSAPSDVPSSAAPMPPGLTAFALERFAPESQASGFHPPSEKVQTGLIESARARALGYVDALVNFKCIEVTDRFLDPKGMGSWPRHDKIAELVTFENHEESRTTVEVNGQPANEQAYDMKSARLEGEFGGVLKAVFAPTSKADFKWKETVLLDGAAVEVFTYRVDVRNSQFSVTALPALPTFVAFHGLVYVDDATRGTLRITMEAEGIPATSPVRASAVTIDYDYIGINGHDYLMPVEGEMRMSAGKREEILHRIEFRDYHRFGSSTRIVGFNP